jgi:hypothetical protein
MSLAFIERLRERRAYRRHAEAFLTAEFAIREIKRLTVRQILDASRHAEATGQASVVRGTLAKRQAIEKRS